MSLIPPHGLRPPARLRGPGEVVKCPGSTLLGETFPEQGNYQRNRHGLLDHGQALLVLQPHLALLESALVVADTGAVLVPPSPP